VRQVGHVEHGPEDAGIDVGQLGTGRRGHVAARGPRTCDQDRAVGVRGQDHCVGEQGHGRRVENDDVGLLFERRDQSARPRGGQQLSRVGGEHAGAQHTQVGDGRLLQSGQEGGGQFLLAG
jgi:hypothetical protein